MPVEVQEYVMKLAYLTSNTTEHAVRDLINTALYFLLQSGEYTRLCMVLQNGQMVHATRTKTICVIYIGF